MRTDPGTYTQGEILPAPGPASSEEEQDARKLFQQGYSRRSYVI